MAEAYDSDKTEALLMKVFDKGGRDYLLTLQDRKAVSALNMMQKELRKPTGMFDAGKIVKAMKTLSSNSGEFPSDYWLDGVICGGDPVAGGGYGDIYKGYWHGTSVAVKFAKCYQPGVKQNDADNDRRHKDFCHEVFQWRRLSHSNILPSLGLYRGLEGMRIGMVSEWQSNGDLKKYLKQRPEADSSQLIQATEGLIYLHEQTPPVVHMDLKPENILISNTGTAMLADFGLSRMKHGLTDTWSSTGNGYTVQYVSPEVAGGSKEITVSSDIWSLGMVVFSAFTGKLPYEKHPMPLIEISKATPPQIPLLDMTHRNQGFTEDLWKFLVQSCWAETEKKRPRARDCSERLTQLKARWLSDRRRMSEKMIEICLPVMRQYARDQSTLRSKMERFNIELEIHEGSERLKLRGKEDNVLAAKAEILSDIESLKKVITETVPIHPRFYARLIGEGGKSVKAMEQKYSVKIQFEDSKGTVEIQGAPQDVSAAKDELKSTVDRLDDFREIIVTKGVSNLVKNKQMEILSKLRLRSVSDTVIHMEGPEKSLNDGEAYVRELQQYLEQEVKELIEGDASLLREIFNEGSWREIVTECGGPSDPVLQGRLIIQPPVEDHFYLRAAPNVLQAVIPKLQSEVERRRKRVIGMEIPQDLHNSLLRQLNAIQQTTGASIFFPKSERYQKFECENELNLTADPKNIVKIHGTRHSCDIARGELQKQVKQERRLRHEIPVSARLHHNVYKLVHRELKANHIQITPQPSQPLPPLDETRPSLPLMDTKHSWERYNIYKDENVTQPECTWLLRGDTEADLEKGIKIVKDVVQQEMHNSWRGLLTFASNSSFGRIVGTQGNTVKGLQEQTNTKIDVPKAGDGTTIVIFGPRIGVDKAKDKILGLTSPWKAVSNE